MPDRAVADRCKVPLTAVVTRREKFGIPTYQSAHRVVWTPDMLARLGVVSDGSVAREFGIAPHCVRGKRLALNIPSCRERAMGGAIWRKGSKKGAIAPMGRDTSARTKRAIRSRISGELGEITRYSAPEKVTAQEAAIINTLRRDLKTRFLRVRKAKDGRKQLDARVVATTYALLWPDGSPHYLGLASRRRSDGGRTIQIRLTIGQGALDRRYCRFFNIEKGGAHAAYRAAVRELVAYFNLSGRQRQTLLDAWPAFLTRFPLLRDESNQTRSTL